MSSEALCEMCPWFQTKAMDMKHARDMILWTNVTIVLDTEA